MQQGNCGDQEAFGGWVKFRTEHAPIPALYFEQMNAIASHLLWTVEGFVELLEEEERLDSSWKPRNRETRKPARGLAPINGEPFCRFYGDPVRPPLFYETSVHAISKLVQLRNLWILLRESARSVTKEVPLLRVGNRRRFRLPI